MCTWSELRARRTPPAQEEYTNVTNAETGETKMEWVQPTGIWDDIFVVVDMAFLCFFIIELGLKLYAWGPVRPPLRRHCQRPTTHTLHTS